MTDRADFRGLYAITPNMADDALLIDAAADALEGGARILQYRNKRATPSQARAQADALRALTREAGAIFIVNDDAALALATQADGVHLGHEDQHDMTPVALKSAAGRPFLVGISCYDELARAATAVDMGADYIAFGSFFPSSTKPLARRASLPLLREARSRFSLPIVAIGGITLDNAPQLIEAGADAIAVISALFEAPDVIARARAFSTLF